MEAYDIVGRPNPLQSRSARIALAASLLVHAALIVRLPVDLPDFKPSGDPEADLPLVVRLAPPFVAPPPIPQPPPAVATPRQRSQPLRPRPPPPAPVAVPESRTRPPVPATPANDLSTYIAARRSERAAEERIAQAPAAAPAEDENARANRIAAANIASAQPQTFGIDPNRSGGMFEVTRVSRDYGEFIFFGWNQDVGRHTRQLIEVQRGSASDIRLVMVRKMIEIIRRREPVEFLWESPRLGRSLMLSSRLRDNSGLEDFMMQEFFDVKR